MVAGKGDGQLWGSGCSAIAGCHCSVLRCGKGEGPAESGGVVPLLPLCVLWLGGRKTTIFGEWTWCHCWVPIHSNGIQTNCLEFLADVTLFFMLITKNWFLLSGVYADIILFFYCSVEYVWLFAANLP